MNQLLNNCSAVLNNISRLFCNYSTDIFIQSGILIILLLIIDFLLRKRVRATFRYWIWMLVLIKLILPPAFSLPTGIGRWFGDCLPTQTSLSKQASNIVLSKPAGASTPLDINRSAEIPQVHLSQDSPEPVAPASFVISNLQALTWQAAVFIIWFIGLAVFSVLLVHRILFVRRLIAQSEPAKNRHTDLLDQCRQRIGIKRKTELRLSDKLLSPAVCGFFRPVILIPTGLIEKLSPDKLKAVLIHELAHVKRGDLWVNCVQTFLQIIYFYNPLVWLANVVICRIREQAVDEMVLVTLDAEAMSYSNTLIDIAEMTFLKTSLSLQLIGVVESKKALSRRIKHILNRPIPKNAKLGALSFVVIILSAIVLLPMAKADRKNPPVVRTDQANEQSVATLPNGVTFEQSKVSPIGNYALGFDGIKDFMEIHASESLKLGRDFTIQTWIKPEFPDTNTPDNGRNLLSKGGYINEHPDDKGNRMVHAYGFSLNLIPKEDSRVELDMSTANGGIYTSPIIFRYESGWLHLAIVSRKEGGGASRGINYIQTGEVPYQPAPNSNIIVGGNSLIPMGNPFKGQIAELRIWNRALDSDEVEHYKTVALTGDEPNLVGCWTFEQGQGQRVHDLSRFRNDASLGSSYAVEDSDPVWVRIGTEKKEAAQDNTTDADKSQFIGTPPNGVTVELVGLFTGQSKEDLTWWRPDGTLMSQQEHALYEHRIRPENMRYLETWQFEYGYVLKFTPSDVSLLVDVTAGMQGAYGYPLKDGISIGYVESDQNQRKKGLPQVGNINVAAAYGSFTPMGLNRGNSSGSYNPDFWDKLLYEVGIKNRKSMGSSYRVGLDTQSFTLDDGSTIILTSVRPDDFGPETGLLIDAIANTNDLDINVLYESKEGKVNKAEPHMHSGSSLISTIQKPKPMIQHTFRLKSIRQENLKRIAVEYRRFKGISFKNVALKPNVKSDVQIETIGANTEKKPIWEAKNVPGN